MWRPVVTARIEDHLYGLTDEQIVHISRRRRESGEFAPGYLAVSLEEETEETLNATPSPELDSQKRRRARARESVS